MKNNGKLHKDYELGLLDGFDFAMMAINDDCESGINLKARRLRKNLKDSLERLGRSKFHVDLKRFSVASIIEKTEAKRINKIWDDFLINHMDFSIPKNGGKS